MKISIIVAVAEKNVIGGGNTLLWHIPADLKRFKEITTGHHILMGQKTFESIGRVLPNRTNLILSDNKDYKVEGAKVFNDLESAIASAKENGEEEVMVIGGGMVYKQMLPQADKIYMTKVNKTYQGDVFFPNISMNEWTVTSSEKHLDFDPPHEFLVLERISQSLQ